MHTLAKQFPDVAKTSISAWNDMTKYGVYPSLKRGRESVGSEGVSTTERTRHRDFMTGHLMLMFQASSPTGERQLQ